MSNKGQIPFVEVNGRQVADSNFIIDHLIEEFHKIMSQVMAQGMGRNTPEEVVILAKKDLDAMSMFLGNKKFFFGDKPVTLDCTMFGHLSQFLYTPLFTPEIKTYMEQNTPNLVAFVTRMKETYWPDWEEATNTRSLSTKWKH
ncbi:hypothetical protein TELCIR_14225 [Teladorsagia circumcincta]|uniref:GST C-terminal domain-containing protein n=1 Tax=Teladorsagia circumcincta TaxID=45464 RepID=A0A2G9U1Y2_TELCI|nr:hypothetical protein TELCIR_14225 [Teladorsagia circumcincta]